MTRVAARPCTPACRPVALAVTVGAMALAASATAAAAPVIEVRARTAITVEPIRRARGATTSPQFTGLRIHGRIHERGSDEPVPGAAGLTVSFDDKTRPTVVTDDGRFDIWFATEGGRHSLRIDYAGDSRFEGSSFSLPELDVAKQPLVLSMRAPDQVQRASGPLAIEVQASDEAAPARVRVSVRFGPAEAEELDEVGQVTTDELGRAPFSLPAARLGPPGPKRVMVVFAGDGLYDPATIESTVLVSSATKLALTIDRTDVSFEGRVRGRGRLTDDVGAALAGEPISLMAEDQGGRRSLDDTLTGADGSFELDAPASELGAGPHMVQALFESPRAYLQASRSPPARIGVAERRPVPVGYSLAAFAATAASIVAFVALRTRPWTRWIKRLRGESAGPGAGGAAEKVDVPPHTGLTLARPGLVSTLRRPHDHGFTGAVADAVTAAPIAGAMVVVRSEALAEPPAIATDDAGGFELEDLPEGEHRAEVSCAGYVTERFALTIPHRGELRDARVDLLPVRERIFQLYREAAEPLLPRPDLWGVWTPRQIFDHVKAARPSRALAELTSHVEESYFSARVPEETELARTEARVAAARAEAAPGALPVDPAQGSEYSPRP
ncbi:MAG TPA: carboxypeptidase regulatory-like domain-containing protein [Kofleriaceae bacterium]|nr:carboxypeptidase regulatory-like domain-containing protein [Kofleriaceae bacterium]